MMKSASWHDESKLCIVPVRESQLESQFQFLLQLRVPIQTKTTFKPKSKDCERRVFRRLPRISSVVFIAPPCNCRCLPLPSGYNNYTQQQLFSFYFSLLISIEFRFGDKHCHWNCAFLHTQSLLILLLLSFHALFLPPNV